MEKRHMEPQKDTINEIFSNYKNLKDQKTGKLPMIKSSSVSKFKSIDNSLDHSTQKPFEYPKDSINLLLQPMRIEQGSMGMSGL